jgi:hypothetical protein
MEPARRRLGRRQISHIAPRFGREPLVVSRDCRFRGGTPVLRHPLVARLLPRLAYQLVPAVLVTALGVLALSSLTRTPDGPPVAAPAQTAIATEAVFTATPREDEPPPAKIASRPTVNPKPVAANSAPLPPHKPEPASRQIASAPAPLPTVQIAAPPQVMAAAPSNDTSMMGRLRSATASVTQVPQWAARSVAGWFQDSAPPRPPAAVPQDFQAAM